MAGSFVIADQDQGVQNRFGAARFRRLRQAGGLVGIERLNFLPETNAMHDVIEHSALIRGRRGFGKCRAESGPPQGIGREGMAGDAKGAVVARGFGPVHPPGGAFVEITGGGFGIPGAGLLRARAGGREQSEERETRKNS